MKSKMQLVSSLREHSTLQKPKRHGVMRGMQCHYTPHNNYEQLVKKLTKMQITMKIAV